MHTTTKKYPPKIHRWKKPCGNPSKQKKKRQKGGKWKKGLWKNFAEMPTDAKEYPQFTGPTTSVTILFSLFLQHT